MISEGLQVRSLLFLITIFSILPSLGTYFQRRGSAVGAYQQSRPGRVDDVFSILLLDIPLVILWLPQIVA